MRAARRLHRKGQRTALAASGGRAANQIELPLGLCWPAPVGRWDLDGKTRFCELLLRGTKTMADLFQSTTIPLLEQVVGFTQNRHEILAGNIANSSTPGYVAQDLSVVEFEKRLKEAIKTQQYSAEPTSPGDLLSAPSTRLAEVKKNPQSILFHDQSQVGLEYQVTEMVKNRIQHNTALSVMVSQFRMLQTAISERV
jgi:flagellar basal-body rod protein FlgB